MSQRSREADTGYQRVERSSPVISSPTALAFISDFERDVTNAFELDEFPDRSATLAPLLPSSYSPDASNRPLLAVNKTENGKKPFFTRTYSGWRGGIVLNATFVGAVLLVNVIVLIWAAAKFKFVNGIATVFTGDCAKAENISIVVHVIINILSTLLLAASNYGIQISASPSRADIDRAHQQQKWLDVGVFSFRNLKWVSKYRIAACGILFLSSVPLHLVYNSILSSSFATIAECVTLYVAPEYFDLAAEYTPPFWNNGMLAKVRTQAAQKQLKHVGVAECNKTIAATIQNNYQTLVFVQDVLGYNNSTTLVDYRFRGRSVELSDDDYWYNVYEYTPHLTDCWAGAAEVDCQLFLNSGLLVGVIIANIIKCGVMILMVLKFTNPSLITRGDAIASFLKDEDPATIGLRSTGRRRSPL